MGTQVTNISFVLVWIVVVLALREFSLLSFIGLEMSGWLRFRLWLGSVFLV